MDTGRGMVWYVCTALKLHVHTGAEVQCRAPPHVVAASLPVPLEESVCPDFS